MAYSLTGAETIKRRTRATYGSVCDTESAAAAAICGLWLT